MDKKQRLNYSGIFQKLKTDKQLRFLVALGLIGAALLIFANGIGTEQNKSENEQVSYSASTQQTDEIQNRLEEILSQIEGVGRVSILITYEDSGRNIYVMEGSYEEERRETSSETSEKSSQNESVVTGGGTDKEPLLETFVTPAIKGVVVVCDGGGDDIIRERIINTVATALQIRTSRIYVTKSGEGGIS